ncbi:sugar nucleotide-binding protein [Candidatus Azambacteria bacterium]|nr:sugar nucleotide-binding protein [Candidatus Azambacteria bacterium]
MGKKEMKTLIFGKGYLGSLFAESGLFGEAVLSGADITRLDEIERDIKRYAPDLVINCAGKANLEWCRDHPLGAIMSNVTGPLNILKACAEKNVFMVHLGSGCIFEGEGKNGEGFREEDPPNPLVFYTYTKALADELLMKEGYGKLLIVRIRQPFHHAPHPRNLITKILSYNELITSPNSMTYVPDLLATAEFLVAHGHGGIFHVCNSGTISPYDLAVKAALLSGLKKEFVPISKQELDEADKRNKREKRVDTILNTDKLARTGFPLKSVHERAEELARYLLS